MSFTVFKDIFISYRRDTGSALASIIKSKIETRSVYSCFLDIENLGSGDFVKALVPYIEQCNAMIVTLTEGYIERCANVGDICTKEVSHAVERNKQLIVVTSIPRKDLRNIVSNTKGLPDVIKDLMNYNIFYIRPGDVIEESIDRMIQSVREAKLTDLSNTALAINRSYLRAKTNRDIRIGPYEFEYKGPRLGNYLLGHGELVCMDSVNLAIEGSFDCDTHAIAGQVKVIYNGAVRFNGALASIDSVIPLKITGTGTYSPNQYLVYDGFIDKGEFSGYGVQRHLTAYQTYTGYHKHGKKHGPGTLRIESASFDAVLKASFFEGLPKGDTILQDYKNCAIVCANLQNRKPIGEILIYYTRFDNHFQNLIESFTPLDITTTITFGATLSEKGEVATISAYQNRRLIAKLDGLNKPHYKSIYYPYNDKITRVETILAHHLAPDEILDHIIYAKDGTTVRLTSMAIINSENYVGIPNYWKSTILTTEEIIRVAQQVELFSQYYIPAINSLNSYISLLNVL